MKQFCFSRINRAAATLFLFLTASSLSSSLALARSSQEKLMQASVYYDEAEKARAALQAMTPQDRTVQDYLKVIRAFRLVYATAPASSKNAKSLMAIGELYQTMGYNFGKKSYYSYAVRAYDFLLREYPYSRYQAEALFTTAQISQSDLNLPQEARKRFAEFLQKYPRAAEAEQARLAMVQLDSETRNREQGTDRNSEFGVRESGTNALGIRGTPNSEFRIPKSEPLSKRVALTDVREWAAAGSTRLVIDVAGEVKYAIGRVENPLRIYVDLYGTKINREVSRAVRQKKLSGEGGLVKSLRAAQYNLDITRVVAELDEQVEYSVFDLPNPFRLIVELRKNREQAPEFGIRHSEFEPESRIANSASRIREQGTGNREQAGIPNSEFRIPPSREQKPQPSANSPKGTGEQAIQAVREIPLRGTASAGQKDASVPDVIPVNAQSEASASKSDAAVPARVSSEKIPADVAVLQSPTAPQSEPRPAGSASASGARPSEQSRSATATSAQPLPLPQSDPRPALQSPELRTPGPTSGSGSGAATLPSDGSSRIAGASRSSPSDTRPTKAETALNGSVSENVRTAQPNRNGTRSLTRALGLKIGRIILDPGHGGHDTGTIGPSGLNEKDLVLDVALRLGKLITQRLGSDVIYTRQDDTFVPLETRTAIANEQQADLFLSIHANSSPSQHARGIETYYLSFATDPEALEVAARENAVSQESIHELQDLVKKIALHEKVDESREFAIEVQGALYSRLSKDSQQRKNRGVKKAPFMVLIGAKMPSVLAEIAFLSNPQEEKLLKTKQQRQKVAEALYSGVAKYVATLSGVKVAGGVNLAPTAGK